METMNIKDNVITINGKALREKLDTNETAHSILEAHSRRQRFSRFTDIDRSGDLMRQHGNNIEKDKYYEVYKALEEDGYGAIIWPRKSTDRTRFEWFYNLKQIANAALNGTNEKLEPLNTTNKNLPKGKRKVRPHKKTEVLPKVTHILKTRPGRPAKAHVEKQSTALLYIHLRENVNIELNLPQNLSKEEVNVIKNALDRLTA